MRCKACSGFMAKDWFGEVSCANCGRCRPVAVENPPILDNKAWWDATKEAEDHVRALKWLEKPARRSYAGYWQGGKGYSLNNGGGD